MSKTDDLPSASRKSLVLEIGASHKIGCCLRRHLSPRTVGLITRSLPLRGTAHKMTDDIVYIETDIDSGLERARSEFKTGDVAFAPSARSICFFLRDARSPRKMTPVGSLAGDVGLLESTSPGTVLSISAA